MVEFPLSHVSRPPEEPTSNAPAVLLLHGYGADERDLLPYAEYLPDDLHVLSVRAPYPANQSGYAWMASGSEPFRGSADLLAEFARLVPEECDVDPERIGLLGFSQGAKAALVALVADPDLYRWAASLNGYLPSSHADPDRLARVRERDRSVFVGVGEEDPIISPEYGEETADLLEDAGLDVTFRASPVGHEVVAAELEDIAEWLRSRR